MDREGGLGKETSKNSERRLETVSDVIKDRAVDTYKICDRLLGEGEVGQTISVYEDRDGSRSGTMVIDLRREPEGMHIDWSIEREAVRIRRNILFGQEGLIKYEESDEVGGSKLDYVSGVSEEVSNFDSPISSGVIALRGNVRVVLEMRVAGAQAATENEELKHFLEEEATREVERATVERMGMVWRVAGENQGNP